MLKKRLLIIGVSMIFIISFLTFLYKNNNEKLLKKDGIIYAITVDGKSVKDIPSKGLYKVDVGCDNATCMWDYDEWMLRIRNITGEVTCGISFNTISKTYFNDKIINLAGTEQGTGQVVHETFTDTNSQTVDAGYRYEGKNPNNWVLFNNELWRIIGVFDSETHGVANTNLVKVIRANSIGSLVWDKSNKNDWSNSSLYNLLNGAYYNKQNSNGGEYCYSYSTTVQGNCDYSHIGIDAAYRVMIKEVTWKLGGQNGFNKAETFYTAERGSATGNSNGYSATKSGYIGLMYPSDYGYSVLASSCARTTTLSSYDKSSCAGQSWLATGYEWTLSPSSSDYYIVFNVDSYGYLTYSSATDGRAVRPSLYLDASTYVIDGTGAEADPYIIGM